MPFYIDRLEIEFRAELGIILTGAHGELRALFIGALHGFIKALLKNKLTI